MRFLILLIFVISLSSQGWCQKDTTLVELEADTLVHSPKKAMVLSAVLPGAGQFYNHFAKPKGKRYAFIKVPVIYAGLGAVGYLALQNLNNAAKSKEEYLFRQENGGAGLYNDYSLLDDSGVIIEHQKFKKNRDLFIAAFVVVWGLNVLDAGVEAHFVNFDISEDLTLNIRPQLMNKNTYGLSLALKFR